MRRRTFLLLLPIFASLLIAAAAQTPQLGKVDFPNSGAPPAQEQFLRGVAALHSFFYEEAREAFQAALKVDPNFALGHWGVAMTYNHPIWHQQDYEAGRRALSQIKDTSKLTAREQAFIAALRVLYGEGDKLARDLAYAAAMEKMYRDNPNDLEAAAFCALALLGTVRPGEKGFQRQMKAGAMALEVYEQNPNHPGAAHYVIHAFDDPEHAILALPAAKRYAAIAPAAHHAQHMPSHIFLQLGMWPEAAASNETAWRVSDEWVKRKNLTLRQRDYHSYYWLTYVYTQQGRYAQAEALINRLRQTMKEHGRASVGYYDDTMAAFIIETQRWDLANELFEKAADQPAAAGEHAGHGAHGAAPTAPSMVPNTRRGTLPQFIRALAAASAATPDAEKHLAAWSKLRAQINDGYDKKIATIRELEVAALINAVKNNFDEAIAALKKATALEEEMSPPSGPPTLIKPAHELFGEILLRAGKPKEAAKQFEIALSRQPNRARSLIGAARAAAQSGDKAGAVATYINFLRIWQQADANLPQLREAREYLGQANNR